MAVESTIRTGNLDFEVVVSGHVLTVDVTEKLGGSDKGPDPHDYLVTALAGCTTITMQMYANRKGIPLESADVKIHITKEGSENRISREIKLIGALTEEQKQTLFAIAEKCPIHNFLERGAKIESRLIEEQKSKQSQKSQSLLS
ncbi:MAG: OsmC family protein [Bdellovibrionales bacterium]